MRNIREICEGIAQRGPWGHTVQAGQNEDGTAKFIKVSFSALMRRFDTNKGKLPCTPRADKGVGYTPITAYTDAYGKLKLTPRRIIRAAA